MARLMIVFNDEMMMSTTAIDQVQSMWLDIVVVEWSCSINQPTQTQHTHAHVQAISHIFTTINCVHLYDDDDCSIYMCVNGDDRRIDVL